MRTAALILAIALSGCSAMFMEHTGSDWTPERGTPHCTGTAGFATWDGFLALSHAVGAVAAMSVADDADNLAPVGWGIANSAFAIGHVVSGTRGRGWAQDCANARARHQRYVSRESRTCYDLRIIRAHCDEVGRCDDPDGDCIVCREGQRYIRLISHGRGCYMADAVRRTGE